MARHFKVWKDTSKQAWKYASTTTPRSNTEEKQGQDYDTVKHNSLVELLQSLDVDDADTRLLTNLYWTQTTAVRCDKDLSQWMSIKQGVRQGCLASPHLFALYTEMIMREIEDMEGFRIGGKVVNNIRYADDTVILAESEHHCYLSRIRTTTAAID